ncbi:MAG: MOSC domain-containing protein YiiM [Saprospiraceae bacterium]|jgi:MOSC domain-containing protein YiiM
MINKDTPMGKMMAVMPQFGEVVWIGIRPERRADMTVLKSVKADKETALEGDRYGSNGKRQVTLIQFEHLLAVTAILKKPVRPELIRRNIVVKGINLLALKDKQFKIGDTILETTGLCHPCSRMEENLGEGGYNVMRGHGGITARIIQSGEIKMGDSVSMYESKKD